jgi:ribonuclease J
MNKKKTEVQVEAIEEAVEVTKTPELALHIIPLGGLNEIGKNMTVIEYGNDIIMIDCGLKFPDDDMLGIDIVIPDYSYLKRNADRIRGIFFTHGHEDHIGALPYFLRDINVPLYGTRFTLGLIQSKLKEYSDIKNVKFNILKPRDKAKVGPFTVELIRVNHSIPDAVALNIETPLGRIIHTGDFKVDYTPIDNQRIDLQKFAHLGNKGVLALLADSTNAERPGHTISESKVGETFDKLFRSAESRIIVATFSSNIHRVQQVINAAYSNNRKVTISGRSMVNNVQVATELGYLKVPKNVLIEIEDLHRYPDNEIVVITTGSQGEPMSALTRIARNEHKSIKIQQGDMVVFSSTPIPGNEKSVKTVINSLFAKGANVVYEALEAVHVSGHACQEELKLMHSLIKPKYFIPVHGEYSHLKRHAALAEQLGMSKDKIFFMNNGDNLEITESGVSFGRPVETGVTMIDGLGIGDVGNVVLRDRKILSEEGLIIVVLTMSKTGTVLAGPDIVSRGFVYVRESEEIMIIAKQVVEKTLAHCEKNNTKEWSSIKNAIKNDLNYYLYDKMRRKPMILPVIMEV